MHILVTDRLSCPRCGPDFGLVLLSDELRDRRVLSGSLGCANCRETFPLRDGFADLRPSPRSGLHVEDSIESEDPDAAGRLAALLGVREGRGPGQELVLIVGPSAGHAPSLAGMIENYEVVAVHPDLVLAKETEGVSRMAVADRLPFRPFSVSGVVLDGAGAQKLLTEALRVLAPGARFVCLGSGEGDAAVLRVQGAPIILESENVLVGVKE